MDTHRDTKGSGVAAVLTVTAILIVLSVSSFAHHGTSISYDSTKEFVAEAVITEFSYNNPHPTIFFDVVDQNGNLEHWASEMQTNVRYLLMAGWTKRRSEEAMKPGTRVVLTIHPSRTGGTSGLVQEVLNEDGEEIVQGRPGIRRTILGQ